jgi:hypothetical protein
LALLVRVDQITEQQPCVYVLWVQSQGLGQERLGDLSIATVDGQAGLLE